MEAPEKIFLLKNRLGVILNSFCVEPDKVLDNIEYVRTDAFIKKVCDAYCKVCGHCPHTVPTHICRKACDYFSDFIKYIKEE